jgi:hypothetical protein
MGSPTEAISAVLGFPKVSRKRTLATLDWLSRRFYH